MNDIITGLTSSHIIRHLSSLRLMLLKRKLWTSILRLLSFFYNFDNMALIPCGKPKRYIDTYGIIIFKHLSICYILLIKSRTHIKLSDRKSQFWIHVGKFMALYLWLDALSTFAGFDQAVHWMQNSESRMSARPTRLAGREPRAESPVFPLPLNLRELGSIWIKSCDQISFN